VNLIGVSPFVGLGTKDFIVGQAALETTSNKVAKYLKVCSNNLHAFILFGFDTFDFLAPEVVNFFKIV
jgi:hypothetical protein